MKAIPAIVDGVVPVENGEIRVGLMLPSTKVIFTRTKLPLKLGDKVFIRIDQYTLEVVQILPRGAKNCTAREPEIDEPIETFISEISEGVFDHLFGFNDYDCLMD